MLKSSVKEAMLVTWTELQGSG